MKTRFRPVVMTSLAFFFGVLPLALATGAGAGAQNAIGTAVVGGMLSATFIDLLFIPLFFVLISGFFGRKRNRSTADAGPIRRIHRRRFSMKKTFLNFSLTLIFSLGGCNFTPKYTTPKAPIPADWPTYKQTGAADGNAAASDLKWQNVFIDEKIAKGYRVGNSQ